MEAWTRVQSVPNYWLVEVLDYFVTQWTQSLCSLVTMHTSMWSWRMWKSPVMMNTSSCHGCYGNMTASGTVYTIYLSSVCLFEDVHTIALVSTFNCSASGSWRGKSRNGAPPPSKFPPSNCYLSSASGYLAWSNTSSLYQLPHCDVLSGAPTN